MNDFPTSAKNKIAFERRSLSPKRRKKLAQYRDQQALHAAVIDFQAYRASKSRAQPKGAA